MAAVRTRRLWRWNADRGVARRRAVLVERLGVDPGRTGGAWCGDAVRRVARRRGLHMEWLSLDACWRWSIVLDADRGAAWRRSVQLGRQRVATVGQAGPDVATPFGVLQGVAMFNWSGTAWAPSAGIPAGATLSLNFLTPGTLDPLLTFTRASTGTYFDATGTMQTAAINAPRWDYDPVSLQLRGLLLEDQRTNVAFPSVVDNTAWTEYRQRGDTECRRRAEWHQHRGTVRRQRDFVSAHHGLARHDRLYQRNGLHLFGLRQTGHRARVADIYRIGCVWHRLRQLRSRRRNSYLGQCHGIHRGGRQWLVSLLDLSDRDDFPPARRHSCFV